jgi:hypothetical protein
MGRHTACLLTADGIVFCLSFFAAACGDNPENSNIQKDDSTVQGDGGKMGNNDSNMENKGAEYLYSHEVDYVPLSEYKGKIQFKTITSEIY